ncbi:ComEC/Rec2 family competence protein [Rhizobium sp. RAF56]|uniref:ComEC/Rec2 family competence protein n=1 Tax=Rhizobium sp. RAF56 TaxID=3233062 RepID=UPI003F9A6D9F
MPDTEARDRQVTSFNLPPPRTGGSALTVPLERGVRTQDRVPLASRARLARAAFSEALALLLQEEAAHGRALLFAPVYMGCGAIIWFKSGNDPPTAAIVMGVVISAASLAVKRQASAVSRHLLFAAMLVLVGMLLAQWQTWRTGTFMLDVPVTTTITGRVERREIDDRGRWRYLVAVTATEAPALRRSPSRVAVLARGKQEPFVPGDIVRGRARLIPPAGPALPNLHDFAFDAYFDGIGANGFFYGLPQRMSPDGDMEDATLVASLERKLTTLRERIGDRIRAILPGDTGAFAASLVNDERRAISPETIDALRVSGLAHIIAISGLNMALSAGIFYVGLRHALSLFAGVAQARPIKKFAAVGALMTVTAYYLISGFGVSAERAFVMMAIMLVAVLLDRPSVSLRNVALSAIVILALSPSEVLGASFQMSFAATLALVSGYRLWTRRASRERTIIPLPTPWPIKAAGRFFAGIAMTSLIGGASTAIFSIEHFHRLATYGLVANLAAMPIVSVIVMPVGMLAMLLMPFGLDAVPWKITGLGLDAVIAIAKTVAAWGGNVPFARLPPWLFPAVVAGILLMGLLRTRLRHIGVLLIVAVVTLSAAIPGRPPPDVMIAEDGDLVALWRDGRLAPNRERPPDFIFEQWQRALAIDAWQPPRMLGDMFALPRASKRQGRVALDAAQRQIVRQEMERALDVVPDGGFACNGREWCAALLSNAQILITINQAAYLGPACDTADIVVTPARLKLDRCRTGARIFSATSLRRSGSVEIDVGSGNPIATTAFDGIARAWNIHRAYDWRSGTFKTDPDFTAQ